MIRPGHLAAVVMDERIGNDQPHKLIQISTPGAAGVIVRPVTAGGGRPAPASTWPVHQTCVSLVPTLVVGTVTFPNPCLLQE